MGWDGKPIPYWLYKLHGLGQVFSALDCMISCKNFGDSSGVMCSMKNIYEYSSSKIK